MKKGRDSVIKAQRQFLFMSWSIKQFFKLNAWVCNSNLASPKLVLNFSRRIWFQPRRSKRRLICQPVGPHTLEMSLNLKKKEKEKKVPSTYIRTTKTWINLRTRTVLSESSLSTWWKFASLSVQNASSEDSDQIARMHRLIWMFAGRTYPMYFFWRCVSNVLHSITKMRLFKYIENFTSKNWKVSDKKLWYFSHFCSKHRLWVLVRTTSARRS